MQTEVKSFQFNTDTVSFYEIEEKGQKEFYIEGYISTKALDLLNDIVTDECMEDMVMQIKSGSIKLDIEHETIHGENLDIIPAGRIIDAKKDNRGVWVKAILNKACGRFKEIWGSVKSGMLDAFSIAFKPIQAITKSIQGKMVRLLHKVTLVNVGLTGNPVNPEAKMTDVFVKALRELPEAEIKSDSSNKTLDGGKADDKMAEEEQVVPDVETVETEASPETEAETQVEAETAPAETAEVKSEKSDESEDEEEDEEDKDEAEIEKKSLEIKALADKNSELEAEVKSLKEENLKLKKELETPEMKSISDMPSTKSNIQDGVITPLQLLTR